MFFPCTPDLSGLKEVGRETISFEAGFDIITQYVSPFKILLITVEAGVNASSGVCFSDSSIIIYAGNEELFSVVTQDYGDECMVRLEPISGRDSGTLTYVLLA